MKRVKLSCLAKALVKFLFPCAKGYRHEFWQIARHTPKPQVDTDLLVNCFSAHKNLLAKLGLYENLSKNQACSPKGIVQVLPLLKGLVDLEPTCEIHGSCLRQAIMEVLTREPGLNTSAYKGSVWVGSRVDRVTTVLYQKIKGVCRFEALCSQPHFIGIPGFAICA